MVTEMATEMTTETTTTDAAKTEQALREAQAIKLAQSGDSAAFETLYKLHSKRLYNICYRIVRNTAEAEDLTQQAFLQLFRNIGKFRGESNFSTWAHRITVNLVLMHLRRKKRSDGIMQSFDDAASNPDTIRETGSSDNSLLGAIDRLNLLRAIRKLPAGYKRIFLLHDLVGYKHSEIASILKCSTGCTKSQIHKARRKLRLLLQGEQTCA